MLGFLLGFLLGFRHCAGKLFQYVLLNREIHLSTGVFEFSLFVQVLRLVSLDRGKFLIVV
ncbi:hypothetical protein [Bradyrhizobium pachyrhizi]|uniref:hypothetical protein n=1 Tax=Bradyrhizobium pachyrhizi TaxID=280333 RepID=UPI00067B7B0F|nr:hypothetical protein [Bradyrhizobium pachyrhizi]